MGLSEIQRLWTKIYKLRIILNSNPHMPVDKARALAQDIEKLAMKLRLRELGELAIVNQAEGNKICPQTAKQ